MPGVLPPSGGPRKHATRRGRERLAASVKVDIRISDMTLGDLITNPILTLVLGIGLSYLGYGPFSGKKNPPPAVSVAVVGLLFRLAGSLLLVWAVFLWLFVISMMGPPGHGGR